MNKILFLLFATFVSFCKPCAGTERSAEEVLSWMKLTPENATQDAVTSLLGKPAKTEENKKKTWWYYTHDNTTLMILWNNKSATLERYSFACIRPEKTAFDTRISHKLKTGTTDIMQAVKLLGIPKDMTIKAVTQEIHYAYSNSVLRLFFRKGLLVDYTLLSQQ